jgi:hypothetical protein
MGGPNSDEAPWPLVARVLGVRHLVQGIAQLAACLRRTNPHRLLGAELDALHGLSDAVLAMADYRRRRLGMTDAVIAGACLTVEMLGNRRLASVADGQP